MFNYTFIILGLALIFQIYEVYGAECNGTPGSLSEKFKCGKKTYELLPTVSCSSPVVYYEYPNGVQKRYTRCDSTDDCTKASGECVMAVSQKMVETCHCFKVTTTP
jgi:hypothetical protein